MGSCTGWLLLLLLLTTAAAGLLLLATAAAGLLLLLRLLLAAAAAGRCCCGLPALWKCTATSLTKHSQSLYESLMEHSTHNAPHNTHTHIVKGTHSQHHMQQPADSKYCPQTMPMTEMLQLHNSLQLPDESAAAVTAAKLQLMLSRCVSLQSCPLWWEDLGTDMMQS